MFRILVVDDERDARQTLQGIIEDAGHTVHSVANEGEALNAAVKERFDLAFIDMRLHDAGDEDESGLSLATAILALSPRTQIVVVTQYPRTSQIVRAIRGIGALGFIEKTSDLRNRILAVLAETEQSAGVAGSAPRDATKLCVSILAFNQPVRIRAQGRYVRSTCTQTNFDLDVKDYLRRSAKEWMYPGDFRTQARRIGDDLWQDIFVSYPEVAQSYLQAQARDSSLVLHVETKRELLGLPIEFVRSRDPANYLVLQHPLMRFACGVTPRRQVISELLTGPDPLRVLIVAANTYPPIPGVDDEASALYEFFRREGRKQNHFPIIPRLIPSHEATHERVQKALEEETYDVLHYAGHASYNPESPEETCLYFRKGHSIESGSLPMKSTELEVSLERSQARLVYLSCCQGAAWGQEEDLRNDDFLGLADSVLEAGIPSVLGFRWPVSDAGSRRLALAFYESLLKHYRPEVALWRARQKLAAWNRDDSAWLSPILVHQE